MSTARLAPSVLALARDIVKFAPGGFSPDEGRKLGADALAVASAIVSLVVPAPLGVMIGGVLQTASTAAANAHSPHEFGAALLERLGDTFRPADGE